MPVFGYVATGGNGMNIHVENGGLFPIDANQSKGSKASFFPRFAKSHSRHVGVAVGVTTGLEPSVEFAVMNQHNITTVGTHNPGRAGDMAD